ncbi:PLP-dependent transferase [Candidatus Woesearchaeota archaeon]|nr:PLP-dependent transferase [Candidatus Woesearchaeota archaeon]
MLWFNEWQEQQRELVTAESFSSEEDAERVLHALQERRGHTHVPLVRDDQVSPDLLVPNAITEIQSGRFSGQFFYARAGHHHYELLEQLIAGAEAGNLSHPEYVSSLCFSSGMAAISATLETLALSSERRSGVVLHGRVMYPLMKGLLVPIREGSLTSKIGGFAGIEVDTTKPEEVDAELQRSKRDGIHVLAIIYEPFTNPTLEYTDTRAVADIAHRHGVPVIVDNTFLTPYLQEALRLGADIVVHSMTKYFSGYADRLGGVVTGPKAFMEQLKEMRTTKGNVMDPGSAWVYAAERVPTLADRMKAHILNADAIVTNLLRNFEDGGIRVLHARGHSDVRNGSTGGVVSFVFNGGDEYAFERSRRFTKYVLANREVCRVATSFGEEQTLILPYAGMMGDVHRLSAGHIPFGLVRVAAGREKAIGPVIEYLREGIRQAIWS